MRAVVFYAYGGPEQLVLVQLPQPEPKDDEVLIRVHCAGVNPVDWKIRAGQRQSVFPNRFPTVLGWDVAGVVAETGPLCRYHAPGAEVFAFCYAGGEFQLGAYADYVCVPERLVLPKPRALSFAQAAAVPLAAQTAWQALFDVGGLAAGATVLVRGAAGGVGGFAVQFARHARARVLATASAGNFDYVRALGAAAVIDYRSEDVIARVNDLQPGGVQLLFDCVGTDDVDALLPTVARGGRLVSIAGGADPGAADARGITATRMRAHSDRACLERIAQLIDDGVVQPPPVECLPLPRVREAHRRSQEGHVRGKLVLEVA